MRRERAKLRALSQVKLMGRKNNSEVMTMLSLAASMEMATNAPELKTEEVELRSEKKKKKNEERPKSTWKGKIIDNLQKVCLKEEFASDRTKWNI